MISVVSNCYSPLKPMQAATVLEKGSEHIVFGSAMGTTGFLLNHRLCRGELHRPFVTSSTSRLVHRPLLQLRNQRISLQRSKRRSPHCAASADTSCSQYSNVKEGRQQQFDKQHLVVRACKLAAGALALFAWLKLSAGRPASLFASSSTATASGPGIAKFAQQSYSRNEDNMCHAIESSMSTSLCNAQIISQLTFISLQG